MSFPFPKKKVLISTLLIVFYYTSYSQNYIDIVKVNYFNAFNAGYEDSNETTQVQVANASLLYPVKLNDKVAIITGLDYTQHNLSLFPASETSNLANLTLKAGLSVKHSKKVSGIYVFLPKLSSENLHSDGNDFFYGGLILLKYQRTEKFQWRFGAYASTEGFGVIATPLIGVHYFSDNKKFEVTATLPINTDVNYKLGNKTALGFGFQAPVKSYNLQPENNIENYVQVSSIELGPYFETRFLDNSLLLRLQGGYSTTSYEVFKDGDTLPFRLSAFEFGDDRNLINPSLKGNLFASIGFIYRFHLENKK